MLNKSDLFGDATFVEEASNRDERRALVEKLEGRRKTSLIVTAVLVVSLLIIGIVTEVDILTPTAVIVLLSSVIIFYVQDTLIKMLKLQEKMESDRTQPKA